MAKATFLCSKLTSNWHGPSNHTVKMFFFPVLELDAEERALTDGRIGPETVGIDRASLCGSMTINDGIEVHCLILIIGQG